MSSSRSMRTIQRRAESNSRYWYRRSSNAYEAFAEPRAELAAIKAALGVLKRFQRRPTRRPLASAPDCLPALRQRVSANSIRSRNFYQF